MIESKILIIDGNSLLNRAYYAIPTLNTRKGQNVNAVFGFVNIMLKALSDINPTHIAVAFDAKGKNFRHSLYDGYKATRKGMPDDLAQQMPVLFELLDKMNIKRVSKQGVEADDVIGTVAKSFKMKAVILTGDRDLLQLVDDDIEVMLTKRGITDVERVTGQNIKELYHMTALQIIEYKALRGDTSDNIPGVSGVGEKTAMSLLEKYGDIETVYRNIEEIKGSVKTKLTEGKDMAFLSKELATIKTDVEIDCCAEQCVLKPFGSEAAKEFDELEFVSLKKKLMFFSNDEPEIQTNSVEQKEVNDEKDFSALLEKIDEEKSFALFISDDVYLAFDKNSEYKVTVTKDLPGGLSFDFVLSGLKKYLESEKEKTVYDSKDLRHLLDEYSIGLENVIYDVSIMQYLTETRTYKDFDQLKQAFGAEGNAAALITLADALNKKLDETDTQSLYKNIELPLSKVLFDMEKHGFKVDVDMLNEFGEKFKMEIDDLTRQAYQLAGEEFNILSPKQLGHILFEKLGLPVIKKTKTGYSTDSDVLDKLAPHHPIIGVIQNARKIYKLSGTYIEGFKPLISKGNLIHTKFNQTLTATGRLSSSEPNLQNLPVREEEGRELRKIFIPTNDLLISADYSQIELRLLAHFSEDENLVSAFNENKDIHAMVASEIFGVPAEMVNSNMRRMAKAVNFGIIYGISDFGLAQNLSISPAKAKDYIAKYYQSYPKISQYLEGSVKFAKEHGYVYTITGRRRYIPEISSSNFNTRSFGERVAKNMPLQGSAADIIKIAMNGVASELEKNNMKSKLILQVHDELVIDAVESEKEKVYEILKSQMTDAFDLKVRLDINISGGKNLYEAK